MTKLKVCSLFSGIGGFETGIFKSLHEDNVEIVFASEIDKHASTAYSYIYGHKPNGDITKIHAEDIPEHDVLVGGFPCQAFSAAGKRQGFDDTRGTLFFDIARIAKEKQPKFMLLENVKGLLNHNKGETFEIIAKTLSEIGYKFDFTILNSKYHGVPQNRERIFIVASRDSENEEWDLHNIKGSLLKTKKKLLEIPEIQTFNFNFPKDKITNIRLKDILENDVESSYYLEPEKEKKILQRIAEKKQNEQVIRIDDKRGGNSIHSWELELKGEVTPEEVEALNKMVLERRKGEKDGNPISPQQVGATEEMFEHLSNLGYLKKVNDKYDFKFGNLSFDLSKLIPEDGISPTVTCTDAVKYGVIVQEEIGLNFLTGVTDKPNWLDNGKELSRNYKQGSRIYDSEGLSTTLSAQGVGGTGGHSGLYLVPDLRIRRLTPLECFRLQGFPDTYYHTLKEAGISNSQIYKMAGNAVTTNVIRDIFNNLKDYLD